MTSRAAVQAALADAHRSEWGAVVAATVRTVRDLDLAEESVQDAYAAALTSWTRDGVPANPAAWLTTAARRRGIDLIRRRASLTAKLPLLVEPDSDPAPEEHEVDQLTDDSTVSDDQLRLIFLCCHPALAPDAQAALTLRLVCGVDTPDIARIFLVQDAAMAARLTRAKRKITGSSIRFRLPSSDELPERLDGVLGVIHLLFTTGYSAPAGPRLLREDVIDGAVRLAETLHRLLPAEPEAAGLLALLLSTDARRATRTDDRGHLLQLRDQDRRRWDRAMLRRSQRLLADALPHPRASRYTLQAAIAYLHADAPTYPTTDWPQILGLYDALSVVWPSPVVRLNRAIVLAETAGPKDALAEVECLADELGGYPYLHATVGTLLTRLGRPVEALLAFRRALALSTNEVERQHLLDQVDDLVSTGVPASVGQDRHPRRPAQP